MACGNAARRRGLSHPEDSGNYPDIVSGIQSRIIVNIAKRTTAAPLGLISPYVPTQNR